VTDRKVILVVAVALAAVVVGAVASATLCAVLDKTLPDLVGDLAKVSLGALGSLLASTRSTDTPAPVTVVNAPSDAVPVEQTPAPAKRTQRKGPTR
jgi:hypothetical protein